MADFETQDMKLADFMKLPKGEREFYRKWANDKLHKLYKRKARLRKEAEAGILDDERSDV
jgi:hypothetical protein